jgi:hypothetical protein
MFCEAKILGREKSRQDPSSKDLWKTLENNTKIVQKIY